MKLTLTVQSGSLGGRAYELESGVLSIGRAEGSDIRFDPHQELVASKRHCQIEEHAGSYVLVDNQSTNGTLLNGIPISREVLKSGDVIQFGRNGCEAVVVIEDKREIPSAAPVTQVYEDRSRHIGAVEEATSNLPTQPLKMMNSFAGLGGSGDMSPEVESQSATKALIGFGIGIFLVLMMSLLVFLILTASVGVLPAVIASIIAFPPALIYILPILGLDRYDPEPAWLLGFSFAWGGLVAVFVSFILNTITGSVAAASTGNAAVGEIVGAVLSAPIVEEGSKGLGVLLIMIFFRHYLDDILDGIVYAAVIGLGFATVENVLYYGRGVSAGGGSLIFLIFVRGVLSPFAHVTFTAMTGIGCGLARESYRGCIKWLFPLAGYFGAVFLHMLWNGMATFLGEGFFVAYLVLEVPFFLIFCGFCFYVMRRQSRIIREMLVLQVAQGIITQDEVNLITAPFRSTIWKYMGLFSGKGLARHKFVRAVGKLGLAQWHVQEAQAAGSETVSLEQSPRLRAQVIRLRQEI